MRGLETAAMPGRALATEAKNCETRQRPHNRDLNTYSPLPKKNLPVVKPRNLLQQSCLRRLIEGVKVRRWLVWPGGYLFMYK